jgi:hypothetical protein
MTSSNVSPLVAILLPELFQAEESARVHPKREANGLGPCPPATAMLAVSDHAAAALPRFRAIAEARGHRAAEGGAVVGRVFSALRTLGSDLFLSREKSYRATVLGVRHGIGVVAFLEDAAIASGDQELADACADWLATRGPLADALEHELAWFAEHPDLAMAAPQPAIVRRVRELVPGRAGRSIAAS